MPDRHLSGSSSDRDETLVERDTAVLVLHRAGYSDENIVDILAGIAFPVSLKLLELRGEQYGISRESLMDRLGGSP